MTARQESGSRRGNDTRRVEGEVEGEGGRYKRWREREREGERAGEFEDRRMKVVHGGPQEMDGSAGGLGGRGGRQGEQRRRCLELNRTSNRIETALFLLFLFAMSLAAVLARLGTSAAVSVPVRYVRYGTVRMYVLLYLLALC